MSEIVHQESKSTELLGRMVGGGDKGDQLRKFRNALEEYRPSLEQALMGRINPDHFIEVSTTALMTGHGILECHPPTVFMALRKAAQLNLRPDGEEGALIAFWNKDLGAKEAVFQPMYKGLVRTLLRTGMYTKVEARIQRTGDDWHYQFGLNPDIRHTPAPPSERGEIEHAYAIVWMRGGGTQFEVMNIEEMNEIRGATRKRNNGREGPAWSTGFGAEQMYRKMPIKRLAKLLELDSEQASVFWYDEQIEVGNTRAEPADSLPEAEWRTLGQRVQQHADRQTGELKDRIGQLNTSDILDQQVTFGKHKGKTWREILEEDRGYVTHWALTDKAELPTDLTEALQSAVESLGASEPSEDDEDASTPPQDAQGGIQEVADRARKALDAVSGGMDQQTAVDRTNEIELLVHEGNVHGLRDVAEELEHMSTGVQGNAPLWPEDE